MFISEVNEDHILFDDGREITFFHDRDCCEYNYADFDQLEPMAYTHMFDDDLIFEPVKEAGFRFGDKRRMFFVPCYSEQNGYYSADIEIIFDGETVLNLMCEEIFS